MEAEGNSSVEFPVEETASSSSKDAFDLKNLEQCLPSVQHLPGRISFYPLMIDEMRMLKIRSLMLMRKLMSKESELGRSNDWLSTVGQTIRQEIFKISPDQEVLRRERIFGTLRAQGARNTELSSFLARRRSYRKERRAFLARGLCVGPGALIDPASEREKELSRLRELLHTKKTVIEDALQVMNKSRDVEKEEVQNSPSLMLRSILSDTDCKSEFRRLQKPLKPDATVSNRSALSEFSREKLQGLLMFDEADSNQESVNDMAMQTSSASH